MSTTQTDDDHATVREIAERSIDEDPAAVPAGRPFAGVGLGRRRSRVRVSGEGASVDLALEIGLRYPCAIEPTVAGIRDRIREEVERVTSYRVRSLDVTVSGLVPDDSGGLD